MRPIEMLKVAELKDAEEAAGTIRLLSKEPPNVNERSLLAW